MDLWEQHTGTRRNRSNGIDGADVRGESATPVSPTLRRAMLLRTTNPDRRRSDGPAAGHFSNFQRAKDLVPLPRIDSENLYWPLGRLLRTMWS